jgi:replication initiation protein RepC
MQCEALGLSESQVKATNRALIEAGLITMKDSPNGKRWGRRDGQKRIVEAYGFDLSPMATRYAEFVRIGQEAKVERAEIGRLRRRATIARNGVAQILETAAEYGFVGQEWQTLTRETRNLTVALRKVERSEDMAIGVASLERRQREARERLGMLLAETAPPSSGTVETDPKGPENRPHQYNYKPTLYPEKDTVMAFEGCKSDPGSPEPDPSETPPQPQQRAGEGSQPSARTDSGTVMRMSPAELSVLAPRLRPYLKTSSPVWPEIIEAADWLRTELGISKPLWGEACLAMGREQAAIAIAIVSAKPAEHFRSTAGGYFHGMVAKAKTGELNLARTIWGLRQATTLKSQQKPGKAGNLHL